MRGHLYKLWSKIIYNNHDYDADRGYYSTRRTKYNDHEKLEILIKLLKNMLQTHDILADLLRSTGHSDLVYTVSKYSSDDMKWMGYNSEKNNGHNNLGKAWMRVRSDITTNI